MKTGLSALTLAVAMTLSSTYAIAADLINEDALSYTVLIDEVQEITVDGGTQVENICTTCSIKLADSAEAPVEVTENSTVIITDGKLVVEN